MKLIDHLVAPKEIVHGIDGDYYVFKSEMTSIIKKMRPLNFIPRLFPDNVFICEDPQTNTLHIYVYDETYKPGITMNAEEYKETSVKRRSKRQHRRRTT